MTEERVCIYTGSIVHEHLGRRFHEDNSPCRGEGRIVQIMEATGDWYATLTDGSQAERVILWCLVEFCNGRRSVQGLNPEKTDLPLSALNGFHHYGEWL